MSAEAEAANSVVNYGVKFACQGAEVLLKLSGTGAKHLAALLAALLKDEKKWSGATKLKRMFREGKPIRAIQIPTDRLKEFTEAAKRHGVLFHGMRDKTGDACTVFVKAEDASLVNRVLEHTGIGVVEVARIDTEVRGKDQNRPMKPGKETGGSPSRPSSGDSGAIEFPRSVREQLEGYKSKADKGTKKPVQTLNNAVPINSRPSKTKTPKTRGR